MVAYPEKIKGEAVKQVVDRGHSVSSIAACLNITQPLRLASAAAFTTPFGRSETDGA